MISGFYHESIGQVDEAKPDHSESPTKLVRMGGSQGFWAFYRQYTSSGIHTAATAALTAVGLLVFVHWSFALLAITIYILPPIVLYLYDDPDVEHADTEATETQTNHWFGTEREGQRSSGGPLAREQSTNMDSTEEIATLPPHQSESTDRIEPESNSRVMNSKNEGDTKPTADTASSESKPENAKTAVETSKVDNQDRAWSRATSPTDEGLCDVVMAADGPYIVGDEGTILTHRDRWEVILRHGPTTNSNALCGAAVSADSRHVWVAGNSGVLGQYDIDTAQFTDYSAPRGITDNWTDIAVVGVAGEETLYVTDDSGHVLRGVNNGGDITWDNPQTPGDGSDIMSVVFIGEAGFLCDTNAGIYETTDDGNTWKRIGIEGAGPDFTDIAPVRRDAISVSCDDGTVFRYDGTNWTNSYVGEEALCAIDRTTDTGLLCGENGAIYEQRRGRWERESTPVEETLHGIAIGTEYSSVAVGEDGTIVEYI